MKSFIVELHQMQRASEESCIEFVAEHAPQVLAKASNAIEEGRAYYVRLKDAIIGCATLPDISDADYEGATGKIMPPIIRPDFDGFGLACLLLPLPVVHAYLYFPEMRELQIRNPSNNLLKALTNLGFSNMADGEWSLPVRRANRSAAELLKVCGRQISTIGGTHGKMRVINRNRSALLLHANRGALMAAARLPEKATANPSMAIEVGQQIPHKPCEE